MRRKYSRNTNVPLNQKGNHDQRVCNGFVLKLIMQLSGKGIGLRPWGFIGLKRKHFSATKVVSTHKVENFLRFRFE